MSFIWDVAFLAIIIILFRETLHKMSSQESPAFAMDPKPNISLQTGTAWGSYYKGSQEQLIGISHATFLRCHKRQQVKEYDHRCAVEASWARLLQPVTGSRSEREEGQPTAVRFAEVVEYIAQTPVGVEKHPVICLSRGSRSRRSTEMRLRKGAVQDEGKRMEVTDKDGLDEDVNKIRGALQPEETQSKRMFGVIENKCLGRIIS